MPGCLMAMARVNRPSVMVYGGTIRAGCRPDRTDDKLDIISAFEAYGKFTAGGSGALESAGLTLAGATACSGLTLASWDCRELTVVGRGGVSSREPP